MSEKVKGVKIRFENGNLSQEIPIGALAQNVDYNEQNVKQTLDRIDLSDRIKKGIGTSGIILNNISLDSDDVNNGNLASGAYSVAEGYGTKATSEEAHVEGQYSIASGKMSHAEGHQTIASGNQSHAEGEQSQATGVASHAEGNRTYAQNTGAHAEGNYTHATGAYSHSEGAETEANNAQSHAQGYQTFSSGINSHAEGYKTKAVQAQSHAEGNETVASGVNSHAEGISTTAPGQNSHAEGNGTVASGVNSHAEGGKTTASGPDSHAEGSFTIAASPNQHVSGAYNIADANNKYAEIIGNGTANADRSNARTLDWSGNEWIKGSLKIGGTSYDDANAKTVVTTDNITTQVQSAISQLAPSTITIDSTLSTSGAAADAKATGNLKNDLNDINEEIVEGGPILDNKSNFISGTYTGTVFRFFDYTSARLINKNPIKVNNGSKIIIKPNTNEVEWDLFDKVSNTGDYNTDFVRTSVSSSWITSETTLNITEDDKYLFFIIRNHDNSNIQLQTVTAVINIQNSYAFINIDAINKKIEGLNFKTEFIADKNWIDGYKIGSTGYKNVSEGSSISPFYSIKKGETLTYDLKFTNATTWFVAFYTLPEFKATYFVAANSVKTINGIKKGAYIAPADGYIVFVNQSNYAGKIIFNDYVPDYAKNDKTFIPAYWQNSLDTVVSGARTKALTIGKNLFDFIFITDTHWTVNAKHSPSLINYIADKLKIKTIIFGGDVITGTQSTRELALNEIYGFFENFDRQLNIFSTLGNHDLNNNSSTSAELTLDEAYPLYIKKTELFGLTDKTTMGAVFDNNSQKVRVIQFLHPTSSYTNADVTSWILSKIAEKNGWTVIVVSHAYWNSEPSGTDLTVNAASTLLGKQIADALHDNSNTGFWLCGHTHRDYNGSVTSDNGHTLTIICTTTDAYSYGGSDGGPEMTFGTNTEQAFDIMQIDTVNRKIYTTRIGAGSDRIINY